MKKVVKLTESDLLRIVKRVISEQSIKWDQKEISFLEKKGFKKKMNTKIDSYEFSKNYPGNRIMIITKIGGNQDKFKTTPTWTISTFSSTNPSSNDGTWVLPADLNYSFVDNYPNVDYESIKQYKTRGGFPN